MAISGINFNHTSFKGTTSVPATPKEEPKEVSKREQREQKAREDLQKIYEFSHQNPVVYALSPSLAVIEQLDKGFSKQPLPPSDPSKNKILCCMF